MNLTYLVNGANTPRFVLETKRMYQWYVMCILSINEIHMWLLMLSTIVEWMLRLEVTSSVTYRTILYVRTSFDGKTNMYILMKLKGIAIFCPMKMLDKLIISINVLLQLCVSCHVRYAIYITTLRYASRGDSV